VTPGSDALAASRRICELMARLDPAAEGYRLKASMAELYPWPRSITGDGLRRTLDWIGDRLPGFVRREVLTGTAVLDWEIPREWTVRQAWIDGPDGDRVVDFAAHNLHLLGYSVPFQGTLPRAELDEHLHSLPEHPAWIPYRTSYYRESWGFCLPHATRSALPDGQYTVRVDTELAPGALSYGELLLPGNDAREIVFSCHVCHPSLANDNLSSLVVAVALARLLGALPARRWTYRFVFVPGTIGAITWLAEHPDAAHRVAAGLVLANLGHADGFTYQRTEAEDAWIDRVLELRAATASEAYELRPFSPFGYDERQYASPGFRLPVGRLTRTPHGEYPEYHTSADDLSLIRPDRLGRSLAELLEIVEILEGDGVYRNLSPRGEPQLGRRDLYRSIGGGSDGRERELALLWVLNQSDGARSLLDVARRAGIPFRRIREAAEALAAAELLEGVRA